ncbi:MAG TPA: hypothetical protein VKA68_00745 [bacterium]|nr:hypothetical protein [bacterium]
MKKRIVRTLQNQLNAWVVCRFIDSVYNMNDINKLPEFIARSCRFCHEDTLVGECLDDVQVHFVYLWINQQQIFDHVQYQVVELITNHDIVSVKIRRQCVRNLNAKVPAESFRWEMFQLDNGKIVQRWTAKS